MTKLIALYSPAAQSGKSTVAGILQQERNFSRVRFAAPLKNMVRGLLLSMGITPDIVERMVEGDLKEAVVPGFSTVTPRRLMQTLGTDWGREAVDNDLWAKVAMSKIKSRTAAHRHVVVDDLRFANEYRMLREIGAKIVRITRPSVQAVGEQRYEGLLEKAQFDVQIVNDGTLEDLREKALAL